MDGMDGPAGKNMGVCVVRRSFSDEVEANYDVLVLQAEECLRGSHAGEYIEASDLLHSGLLRAEKVFHRFDPVEESFVLWMGAILELRCRAFARTVVRTERMAAQITERYARNMHKTRRRRIAVAVSSACLEIPRQYRKATVMFFLGGHPVEDIATECKIDVRTAEFYIQNGQKALREYPALRILWEALDADAA